MDSAAAISHLDDLELAVLVCLVAKEHCIIRAPQDLVPAVGKKLESIAREIYDLATVCLECGSETSIAELQRSVTERATREGGEEGSGSESRRSRSLEEDFNVRRKIQNAPFPSSLLSLLHHLMPDGADPASLPRTQGETLVDTSIRMSQRRHRTSSLLPTSTKHHDLHSWLSST
jgi:hypothetical protein